MKKTILFIEDNEQTRNLYKQVLAAANFSVDSAVDGNAAYLMLGKKKYDLMLVDLMMTGMDGLAFAGINKEEENRV